MKKQKTIKEDIHFRVLRLIEKTPEITQRELAYQLGISLGSVNFCIKSLIEMGQIKIKNFERNPHKLDYLYLLTPSGIEKKAKLAANFLKRKLVEYELLKHEIDSLLQDREI